MTFVEAKAAARERWGMATAFRIGLVIGEAGDWMDSPYPDHQRTRHFRDGLAVGRREFLRKRETRDAGRPAL